MKRKNASKKGMTLVEVLLALVILSIGVTSLMIAMSRCLSVVGAARNREVARALILRVDIEFPLDEAEIDELSESGEFEDHAGFAWFRDIVIVDEEERPGLFQVTTRVQWAERGRDTFEEITVFKYAPNAERVTSQI